MGTRASAPAAHQQPQLHGAWAKRADICRTERACSNQCPAPCCCVPQWRVSSAMCPRARSSCCSTASCWTPVTCRCTTCWTRCGQRWGPRPQVAAHQRHGISSLPLVQLRPAPLPPAWLSPQPDVQLCLAPQHTHTHTVPTLRPLPGLTPTSRQVRLYDALSSVGLPPAQVRQAQLLRGSAAGADEPPRLRLPLQDGVLWVSRGARAPPLPGSPLAASKLALLTDASPAKSSLRLLWVTPAENWCLILLTALSWTQHWETSTGGSTSSRVPFPCLLS